MTISELLGIDTAAKFRVELNKAMKGKEVDVQIKYSNHLSGAECIHYHIKPDLSANGIVKGLFITERDCTYEQHARKFISGDEEGFMVSRQHLAIIFENASDPIFVFKVWPDKELTYQSINKKAAELLRKAGPYKTGYEVIDKTFKSVFLDEMGSSEEAYKLRCEKFEEVLETRSKVTIDAVTNFRKSKIYHETHFTPTMDDYGNIEFIVLSIRDVTALKEAHQKINESRQRLSLVFNNTSDIMVLVKVEPDHKYIIESSNDAYDNYGIENGFFKRKDIVSDWRSSKCFLLCLKCRNPN